MPNFVEHGAHSFATAAASRSKLNILRIPTVNLFEKSQYRIFVSSWDNEFTFFCRKMQTCPNTTRLRVVELVRHISRSEDVKQEALRRIGKDG